MVQGGIMFEANITDTEPPLEVPETKQRRIEVMAAAATEFCSRFNTAPVPEAEFQDVLEPGDPPLRPDCVYFGLEDPNGIGRHKWLIVD